MKRLPLSVILGLVLSASAPAAASEPSSSDGFALLFPENVSRALVVALPQSSASREVERAIGDALHASGRVGRIVPSSVIGTLGGLPPAEVTARALRLPIDAVVVASAAEDGTTVLLATYRDGSHRGPAPFSLVPPKKVAEPAPAPSPEPATAAPVTDAAPPLAKGPPAAAAAAPAAAPAPEPARSPEEARNQFDEKFVGFKDSPTNVKRTQPYEGRYQRALDWPEFYEKVGRSDLAERSASRRGWGKALLGTGIILSVTGILSFGIQSGLNVCGKGPCTPSSDGYLAGAVFQGVGLVGIIAGSAMPRAVVPAWDARRLGESYNWQLRTQLHVNP